MLFVDQFEELFTASDEDTARDFVTDLVDAAALAEVLVVVSMRADFYGSAAAHPEFAAMLQDSNVLVGPMTRGELHRAVTGPARVAGLVVEPGLADAVVHDADDEPGLLPLVSTALLETWERRRGRSLTLAGYAEAGGVRGAVARLAEDTYESLDDSGRHAVRRIMLRLASATEQGDDLRRRVPLSELGTAAITTSTLATLSRRRLITVDHTSAEVAHEALFRNWPRLRAWLDEDRDGRRQHQQLAAAAFEWERNGRDSAQLLRGSRLAAAVDLASGSRADLNPTETDFVDASREQADAELRTARRTARRLRGLLTVVAVVAVLAVIAGVSAFVQRGHANTQARRADARSLAAAEAIALEPTSLQTSLLLAAEGFHTDDSVETRGSLLAALDGAQHLVGYLPSIPTHVLDNVGNADGSRIAILTDTGDLSLFDTSTWKQVGGALATKVPGANALDVSRDGRLFALEDANGAQVYDFATGRAVGELLRNDHGIYTAAFDESDGLLATAARFSTDIDVWDLHTDAVRGTVHLTADDPAVAVIVLPRSETLVATSYSGTIYRFDLSTLQPLGAPVKDPTFGTGGGDIDATPDGSIILVATGTNLVVQYDSQTLQRIGPIVYTAGSRATSVRYIDDDRYFLTASDDGTVQEFGAQSGILFASMRGLTGVANFVYLDNRKVFSDSTNEAAEWDLDAHVAIGTTAFVDDRGNGTSDADPVDDARQQFVIAGQHGVELRTFDGASVASRAPTGVDEVDDTALSTDHGSVFYVGSALDANGAPTSMDIGRLALPSLEPIGKPLDLPGSDEAFSLAASPDGTRIAIGTRQGRLLLYDIAGNRLVGDPDPIDSAFVGALAWSSDSSLVFAGGQDGVLRTYDPASRRLVGALPLSPGTSVTDIVFTPDGSQMIASSESGEVFFVDAASHQSVATPLTSGGTQLQAVDISPDGATIAAISRDGAVRLWDRASHRPIGSVSTHSGLTTELAFSADGRSLVTFGFDDAVVTIDLRPDAQADRACALAGRNLTREEWARYAAGRAYHETCSPQAANAAVPTIAPDPPVTVTATTTSETSPTDATTSLTDVTGSSPDSAAVGAAVQAALGSGTQPFADRQRFLADADDLEPSFVAVGQSLNGRSASLHVGTVSIDGDTAVATVDVAVNGTDVANGLSVGLVRVDGEWKVTRAGACTILALASPCPTR